MKFRIVLSLCSFLMMQLLNAQIGIGTTSPNATLDIRSGNQVTPANTDGILIPKVDAFPFSAPGAAQQGMLVYLTTTAASKPPGFYYWDNATTSWIGISNGTAWQTNGNTGTTPVANFFGTIDDQDIVFKRFNTRAAFIGNPNTSTGNMNTAFGANSLVNPSAAGTRNVAIGTNILPSNTTGNRNISIGDQSMFSNTTGIENTAIGVGALYSSVSGVSNVAIGRNALTSTNGSSGTQGCNNTGVGYVALRTNTTGAFNTALGRETLYTNLSGNYNVGIGYQAGYLNSTGGYNVFLGQQAGYNETTSNRLYIENSNADADNALIYGEFDNNIIRANGQLQIGNPSVAGYALPTIRGSNTQFLQTNGAGATSWAAIPVNTVNPYADTGASSGIYNITTAQYTVRVFNGVSEVKLPAAVGNTGKIFIVIGSNGIGSKIFSTLGGGIYDDVTNATITVLNPNERYTVQSDGSNWIVVGR